VTPYLDLVKILGCSSVLKRETELEKLSKTSLIRGSGNIREKCHAKGLPQIMTHYLR
jgi:hypothetical protein